MQIMQSQGKILQKSALHEVPRRWEIKKYYGIFHLGQLHVTCFDPWGHISQPSDADVS